MIGNTQSKIHQTHKPRRYKHSVGGSYLLEIGDKSISFNGIDVKNGGLKAKCEVLGVSVIAELGDFDYQYLAEEFKREFDEK